MRILVVEDNHCLNSSLAASLSHEGYSVDDRVQGLDCGVDDPHYLG